MQMTIFIIFILLVSLIGMRVWFLIKHDKTGTKTFWEAVYDVLHEDGGTDDSNKNDN